MKFGRKVNWNAFQLNAMFLFERSQQKSNDKHRIQMLPWPPASDITWADQWRVKQKRHLTDWIFEKCHTWRASMCWFYMQGSSQGGFFFTLDLSSQNWWKRKSSACIQESIHSTRIICDFTISVWCFCFVAKLHMFWGKF